MRAEVWILESVYDEWYNTETFLYIPGADLWLTDIGYSVEHVADADFTESFYSDLGYDYILTKIGKL